MLIRRCSRAFRACRRFQKRRHIAMLFWIPLAGFVAPFALAPVAAHVAMAFPLGAELRAVGELIGPLSAFAGDQRDPLIGVLRIPQAHTHGLV